MSVANAINLTASLSGYNPNSMGSAVSRAVTALAINMINNPYVQGAPLVPTDGVALALGGVTVLGWTYFRNLSETNYVDITNGDGGDIICRLYPGEPAFLPLAPDAAPFAIANTSACEVEYLIFSR